MRIREVVEWFKSQEMGRLRLPPIQRSFVWRNEQILNYWDSLMRGYPAGMMMVTRVKPNGSMSYGRNIDGRTEKLDDTDFLLFDGQQRLISILLGFGQGALAQSLQVWVDIGKRAGSGDRLYDLRMNSDGQPFGYQSGQPNEKVHAADRRNMREEWPRKLDDNLKAPDEIFRDMAKADIREETKVNLKIYSSECAISLSSILSCLIEEGKEKTSARLEQIDKYNSTTERIQLDIFLEILQNALDTKIVLKLVDSAVLEQKNYVRFFGRLGQGAGLFSSTLMRAFRARD